MSKFVIIPDSASDLTIDLMRKYNIPEMIPLILTVNDKVYPSATGDWTGITSKEFYNIIKNKNAHVTSGAPSPEQCMEIYEKYLKQGLDVLIITISSALSSTYSYALKAKEELSNKYPERKIYILDSKRYSTAELLLIINASRLQSKGYSIEETYEELVNIREHLHQAGPMDDLMFLASKGRISNSKAFMGTIIGINPIGEVNKEGLTKVLCKVKGSKKALQVCIEYMKKTIIDPSNQTIVIAHSNREEKAKLYKELIEKTIQPKEIIMTEVGMACAPTIGPGVCAAYYYGTALSEDLTAEKQIFDSITKK